MLSEVAAVNVTATGENRKTAGHAAQLRAVTPMAVGAWGLLERALVKAFGAPKPSALQHCTSPSA